MDEKKEGGFLQNLSNLGQKLVDTAFPNDNESAPSKTATVGSPNSDATIKMSVEGFSDPEIRETLLHALNGYGIAFGQFLEMVESFREVIPDEKQRYKAALVAMKKTSPGFNVDTISKALDERVQVLEGEHQKFLKTLSTQEVHIHEMEKVLQAKATQIESLQNDIQKLEREKGETEKAVLQEREKVAKIQKTFESSLEEIQKEILESKATIQKLLS